jgi:hypothetical protein
VKLSQVKVTEQVTTGQNFHVAGSFFNGYTDAVLVQNLNGVLNAYTPPALGQYADVVGVIHIALGVASICPRGAADITSYSSVSNVLVDYPTTISSDVTVPAITVAAGGTLTVNAVLTVTNDLTVRAAGW